MQLNYKKGAIPLYLQVKEIVKKEIEEKKFQYGELIPSELELEKLYQVSRITIRQAISELEKEGYVKRARGKGTSVTFSEKIDESLSAIRSFTKEMEDRGLVPGTSFVEIKKIKATEDIADHLDIDVDSDVFRLYRIRTGDEEPVVIFETYLNGDYNFPLDSEKYQGSMYAVFEEIGLKTPVHVEENFQAMLAEKWMADALKVKVGSPIFKRVRIAYNNENKAIEYLKTI